MDRRQSVPVYCLARADPVRRSGDGMRSGDAKTAVSIFHVLWSTQRLRRKRPRVKDKGIILIDLLYPVLIIFGARQQQKDHKQE